MTSESDGLDLVTFAFGAPPTILEVRCRKTLAQTINFRTTMQCEVEDLYESLRGFGGGLPDWSEEEEAAGVEAVAAESGPEPADPNPHVQDLLGLDIWPAALELCTYLSANPHLVAGKAVLELGAGVGLPALLAAKLGAAHAVLTDYEPRVMDHVALNAERCGVAGITSGLCLDWTRLGRLPPQHRGRYSVLLAADVLYIQDIMPGFVAAALALLAPGGVMLVGHQTRRALVLEAGSVVTVERDVSLERFEALCAGAGLHLRQLGSRPSPGFPGPLLMLGAAREGSTLAQLPAAFPLLDGGVLGAAEVG